MTDLVRWAAENNNQFARTSADASAQLGMNLANIASSTAGAIGQHYADAPKREAEAKLLDLQTKNAEAEVQGREAGTRQEGALRNLFSGEALPSPQQIYSVVGPERGTKIVEALGALERVGRQDYADNLEVLQKVMVGIQALPESMRPEAYSAAVAPLKQKGIAPDAPEQYDAAWVQQRASHGVAPKVPEPFTLSPGETRFGPDGQPLANVPEPEKVPEPFTLTPGAKRFGPDGNVLAEVPTAPRASDSPSFQAKDVIDPATGKPTPANYDSRTGKYFRPDGTEIVNPGSASTRDQGRQVISGDADEIADLNDSLGLLSSMGVDIGKTGASSEIAAKTPNFLTEWTGWGRDAKSRQAVIDKARQIIGKSLEGGVLRKEDEYKYAKILPTIGDDPEVAKSKIVELFKTIEKKRQNKLDALHDAGYDVTRFLSRPTPKLQNGDPGGVTVTTPDGQTFSFPNKAAADGFKKRAGIP
jgi:hypothetical protein